MTTIANKIGFIYKIVCKDLTIKDLYVGSCQSFRTRKNHHKHTCNTESNKGHNAPVYTFIRLNGGWDNWSIIQVEEYNFNNRQELRTRERYWLEQLQATLNYQTPSRTRKEKNDTYRQEGRYKDRILAYSKEWKLNNKDKTANYNKILVTCECHKTILKNHYKRHCGSKQHKQFIDIQDYING
jgi:hypothetical protein